MKNRNHLPQFSPPKTSVSPISLVDLIKDDCGDKPSGLLCQKKSIVSEIDDAPKSQRENDLAIFFLDIRNYTGLLQTGNQYETIQIVKKLMDLFTKIITKFGGSIVDRAGDSLYAVYGLKTALIPAVNQAMQATKLLFDLLDYANQQFIVVELGFPLEVGVGLHTGHVFVEYGRSKEEPFSVMGLPVNITARLQQQTKRSNNDLIISQAFYELLSHELRSTTPSQKRRIRVAGVQAPQTVWYAGKPYIKRIANSTVPPPSMASIRC
jgi:adenylate cyclase